VQQQNSAQSASYDAINRLLSITTSDGTVTQVYDTKNRVVSRTINGVTTYLVWDGWDLIEERDAAGNELRRYVHGAAIDEILAMIDTSGAHYHHHDALGNVIALSDGAGGLEETYRYDAFGKVTVTNAGTNATSDASFFGNRFLYTGREWIAEAGLYDYRNRVYSAALGRFMQTDPILFEAGDVNIYRYAFNNVVSFRDPWGQMCPRSRTWCPKLTGQA
jgi:RHS repeat-associated protein